MADDRTDLLEQLWDEVSTMPFPPAWYQREPGGQCLVTLHAVLAGSAAAVLDGPLDPRHRAHLRGRLAALARILPAFAQDPYAAHYFETVHRMAALAERIDRERTGD
ncbi:hypothetical protein [Streptomyces sp. TLI_171]|uniref:hypothetical protein n=1 Tax=Streptomyces sp. TLI_171 TaxID=1938859 RepID=UPI00117F6D21|nr:hypothetical protein [Streptomyces sp. TLI_171]